ncbi:MAG TPA: hypothetical protein VN132_02635 [Bdellovibrio sp.]|nr:hypothetical protein [Bdellovibrio sp.]
MKYLFAILFAFSLAACDTQQDQDPKNDPNGPMVNETDYTVCHTDPAPHTIEGTWYMAQSQGSFHFITTYQIGSGYFRLINDCNLNGVNLRAQAQTTAAYDAQTFQPLKAAYDSQKVDNPNFHAICEASIAAVKASYTWEGNCLVFYQPGQQERTVLAPR